MKNLVIKFLQITFCFIFLIGYSQHSDIENLSSSSRTITTIDLTSKDVVGSSYLNENFTSAKISNDEKVYFIRYNAHKDEMEVQLNNKTLYLNKEPNLTVTFEGIKKVYKIYDYSDEGNNKKGFFVLIYDSPNFNLLLKEKINLHEEVPAKLGFSKYEPPKLKRSKDQNFYSLVDQKSAIEIPNKKKEFYKLFLEKSKDVEKFVKTQQLSIKDQSDLIRIFEYYNTL